MATLKAIGKIVLIGSIFVIIEKKTGVFTWILTAGGKFKNPLVS